MPDSVKSCGSSRRSICSRNGSVTSINTNSSQCSNFPDKYDYFCKAYHTQPLRDVKVHLSRNTLSFIGDRIKYEDWIPLLKAIKGDKFLHFICIRSRSSGCVLQDKVNCEKKVRECKGPAIFTKYVLVKLMHALSESLSQSRTLRCLQLQTLPLHGEPIQVLSMGIETTRTLQHLSLQSCKIGDEYCEILCRAIRNKTSLLSLDLSNNELTEKGAASIAHLLKAQEIARYGECWKHSLRYRDVPNELIPGLRRITINNNPDIGDKGLREIIDVLYDDHWIKAIDMQNCGITDWGCDLIMKLVNVDIEIVIFDVRRNPILDTTVIANIVQTLAVNATAEDKSMYGWLDAQANNLSSSAASSAASVKSFRTQSDYNLSQTKSKNQLIDVVKSRSTPAVPRSSRIIAEKIPSIMRHISMRDCATEGKSKALSLNTRPKTSVSRTGNVTTRQPYNIRDAPTQRSNTNKQTEEKKQCKKTIRHQIDGFSQENNNTNIVVNVSKHSINLTQQNIISKNIRPEQIPEGKFHNILSSESSDSEIEFNIKERHRHLQHTFKKFLKSQESMNIPTDSDSEKTVRVSKENYLKRCISNI